MQKSKVREPRAVPPANCPTWARNPAPPLYDDEEQPPRMPTSTRRYQPIEQPAPTRTFVRVTKHEGPPPPRIARASRTQEPAQQDPPMPQPMRQRRGFHPHPLLWVGLALCVMVAGWVLLSMVVEWWQVYQNDLHYGRPRTSQIDMVVGHNDSAANPSHFIALNLHDHTQVLEFPGGDASKAKVYIGPTLAPGHELDPVTVSFRDVNGDGKLDLVLTVDDLRFVFINDNGAFRPPHEGEKVNV